VALRKGVPVSGEDEVSAVLGPFYDESGLARRWGCTPDDVDRLRAERGVLGVPTDDGRVLYPAAQFVAGTDASPVPIPGLSAVLVALYEWHDGHLGHAMWLATPSPRLGGRPAYQHLQAHGHHQLVALAQADAARGLTETESMFLRNPHLADQVNASLALPAGQYVPRKRRP